MLMTKGGPSPCPMSTWPSFPKADPRGESPGLNLPVLFLVHFSGFFSLPLSDPSSPSPPPPPFSLRLLLVVPVPLPQIFHPEGFTPKRQRMRSCRWASGGTPQAAIAGIDFFVAKLVVGISGAPPGCNRLPHGEACCWVCGDTPQLLVVVFGATTWLRSTSSWRSCFLGFRGEVCCCSRLRSTSMSRSLLVSWRGHPAPSDFFAANLVVELSGALPGCN